MGARTLMVNKDRVSCRGTALAPRRARRSRHLASCTLAPAPPAAGAARGGDACVADADIAEELLVGLLLRYTHGARA